MNDLKALDCKKILPKSTQNPQNVTPMIPSPNLFLDHVPANNWHFSNEKPYRFVIWFSRISRDFTLGLEVAYVYTQRMLSAGPVTWNVA